MLVVVSCHVSLTRSKEPSYQGKKLTQWLEELPDLEPELQGDAELHRWKDVFCHMGSNAVPFLLKMIQANDSALKAKVIDWAERHDVSALRLERAAFRQDQAAIAFRLLGSHARPAIPELVSLMKQARENGGSAAYALAGIGQEAVLPLSEALTNQTVEIRTSAAFALCGLNDADGSSAVPNLIAALNDTNRLTRLYAITALRHIDKRLDLVLPALAERLTDKDAVIRTYASSALAGITNASHKRTAAE